ncbi:MAG: DUF1302 domain-containing protein [Deltaproteobacteria bacterium]|nr:DUF1302 domain-containing protein [Deltaproteobacteria bacterium]
MKAPKRVVSPVGRGWGGGWIAGALVGLGVILGWAAGAGAFNIDTGVPDLRMRWDNTVKYSVGMRVEPRDDKLLANPNNDDGDRNFDQGSLIFNRFDLFSEFDVTYRGFGARASGAAWYDFVYNSSNDNNSPATSNRLDPRDHDEFPHGTERIHGGMAELLDAFVFGKVDLGNTTLSARAGQYALQWGESLFFGANGIAGGMSPVDVVKLLSSPNSQFKEFIRPTPQVSAQYVLTPALTVGAYYKLGWDKVRIPGIGSYFAAQDVVGPGGEQILTGAPFTFVRGDDMEPRNSGQGGVQVKFRPGWGLDLGLYAIRFHEMGPQVYVYLSPIDTPGGPVPVPDKYRLVYPEAVQAYGVSATKTFGKFNWAAEVSARRNMDLPSESPAIIEAFGVNASADNNDNPLYAVGNTLHAQINWLAGLGPSFIANEADFLGEIAWNRLLSVTDNEASLDPGTTRNAWGFRLVYEPKYRQVLPGLDLSVPAGFAYFPAGKSSVLTNFGPHKGGDMNIGLAGVYLDTWRFSLSYTHFYGPSGSFQDPATSTFTFKQSMADRDFVAFSVRRTF